MKKKINGFAFAMALPGKYDTLVSGKQPTRVRIYDSLRWPNLDIPAKHVYINWLKVYLVDLEIALTGVIINTNNG